MTGKGMTDQPRSFLRWREIPTSIWALGLVSLLMDTSSEMIHALLPLYLVSGLGASTLTVGVIEGLAANRFTLVFWIAVVPAFLCVAVLIFGVQEPDRRPGAKLERNPLRRAELARLGSTYWLVVIVASVFTLARFSEAFLLLRAQS